MRRLTLDAIELPDAVARSGSFSGAGLLLNKVTETASYAVAKLESDLEVALFHRHAPRVELTQSGTSAFSGAGCSGHRRGQAAPGRNCRGADVTCYRRGDHRRAGSPARGAGFINKLKGGTGRCPLPRGARPSPPEGLCGRQAGCVTTTVPGRSLLGLATRWLQGRNPVPPATWWLHGKGPARKSPGKPGGESAVSR